MRKNYYIYADSYLHLLLILQSASCFQHFLLSNIILFPNIYILSFIIYNFPPADTYVVVWCFFNNFSKKYHPKHKKQNHVQMEK